MVTSLVPPGEGLAGVAQSELDIEAGKRTAARVAKSVIRSVKRNTYRGVQELLDLMKKGARVDKAFDAVEICTPSRLHADQVVQAAEAGMPVMRAMPLEFAGDPACDTLERQYMLGERLLVAPVPVGPITAQSEMWGFGAAVEMSRELAGMYRIVAADHGAAFFDAGSVAEVAPGDGVHLSADACASLGAAMAEVVRAQFEA